MARTKAQAGKNSILSAGNGASPEVFTKISEIKKIGAPKISAKMYDASNMDSDSDADEFVPTMINSGKVSFEGNCLLGSGDATHLAALTDLRAKTLRNFKYQLPTPPGGSAPQPWTFSGFYETFEIDSDSKAGIDFKCSIQVTGVWTIPGANGA